MVIILSINDQYAVNVIAEYWLSSSKIIYMKSIPNSSSLIVIDEENSMFLIRRETNTNDDIKKLINFCNEYTDYSVIEANGILYMLLLCTQNDKIEIDSNNCIDSCDFIKIELNAIDSHQMQTIPFTTSYCAMQFQYNDTYKYILAAKHTDIDLLQLNCNESGKIDVNLLQTISTSHLFGTIQFTVNAASILTHGNDAQILLWDKHSMRMVKSVVAHDKCSGGVKDAILDSMQR